MEPQNIIIKVLFARHGETEDNKSHTLAGHQPGKLTHTGKEQAKKIGKYLKNHSFDHIYVSDLGRTKETFQNILKEADGLKNISTTYSALLRQKSGGVLEGKPLKSWGQNAKKEGKNIRDYKSEGGESWKDVMERGIKFIKQMIQMRKEKLKNKEGEIKLLAISHGGYIMQFHNICRLLNKEEQIFDNTAKNCSMHEFQITYPLNQEQFKMEKLKVGCTIKNFVGHLS